MNVFIALKGTHFSILFAPKDNQEIMLLNYTKCQRWKREIILPNIHRILPKVYQVIYTLDTIYEPNIMTLAQAVLQIFCSQSPLWVKNLSPKKEIIHLNFHKSL